jgi:hypothetical protein
VRLQSLARVGLQVLRHRVLEVVGHIVDLEIE